MVRSRPLPKRSSPNDPQPPLLRLLLLLLLSIAYLVLTPLVLCVCVVVRLLGIYCFLYGIFQGISGILEIINVDIAIAILILLLKLHNKLLNHYQYMGTVTYQPLYLVGQ